MSPYFGLYFEAWGLTITQISLLLAMPQLMRVVAPPFWGAWADRAAHRASLLQVSAAGALLAIGLIAWAQGAYGWLLVLVSLLYFFTSAQGPIAESMALAAAGGDPGSYGRMRQWGSIGFIAAVAATGPLLDWLGARWLMVPMGALAILVLLVSWQVARASIAHNAANVANAGLARRGEGREGREGSKGSKGSKGGEGGDSHADIDRRAAAATAARAPSVWRRLREPRIALFFVSCGLMMFAHAALYAFFSLYLDRHGYAKTWIGAIWALGVVAEIALFRWQRGLFERFGALPLLSFSMACAALRFALIGWGEGQWGIVLVSQLLHAITFGVHHSAAMALLHRWFEPGEQGRAQALFVTLGYGVGGSIGGLAAGWWWDHVAPGWAFYSAALAAGLGWLAVAACRRFEYAAAAPRPRPVS